MRLLQVRRECSAQRPTVHLFARPGPIVWDRLRHVHPVLLALYEFVIQYNHLMPMLPRV